MEHWDLNTPLTVSMSSSFRLNRILRRQNPFGATLRTGRRGFQQRVEVGEPTVSTLWWTGRQRGLRVVPKRLANVVQVVKNVALADINLVLDVQVVPEVMGRHASKALFQYGS